MTIPNESSFDRRQQSDRREEPTPPWGAFPLAGWRLNARRASEHGRQYFVDRFSAPVFVLIVVILISSMVDAVLTLDLIDEGEQEVNPVMSCLLERGVLCFLVGKYALTAVGLPLLLIFKNHYLFGTRFRVGYLIHLIVFLYLILIAYQVSKIVEPAAECAPRAAPNRKVLDAPVVWHPAV
jgi:putative copper export protein